MSVTKQIILFLEFMCVGMLLGVIFDMFRAYRKLKKTTYISTIIQDILYFVIATVIVTSATINFLNSNFRLYIIIAVLLGVSLHTNVFSKFMLNFFILFFKASKSIFEFLNITFVFYIQIFTKILMLFGKIVKKCCKSFFYVVNFKRCKDKILHKNKTKEKKLKEG